MKHIRLFLIALLFTSAVTTSQAQTTENYLQRYDILTRRVGSAGIGVETLLTKWKLADPSDINCMLAWFKFHYAKAVRDTLIISPAPKYYGADPVLSLKDSSGNNVNYFNDKLYDKQQLDMAVACLDEAISIRNTRLDIYLTKGDVLVAAERERPSEAVAFLSSVIDRNFTKGNQWEYPGKTKEEIDFADEIWQFCYDFYNYGTPGSYGAMKTISEKMLKYEPANTAFINNLGAYYAKFAKDDKKALKYYRKSLKIKQDDSVALQNVHLIEKRSAKH